LTHGTLTTLICNEFEYSNSADRAFVANELLINSDNISQVKKWFAHYRSEIVDKVAGDKNQLSTHAMTFVAAEHRTRRSQGRG